MPRTIWKYELQPECTIPMPEGAKVLHVREQFGSACMWVEVDPSVKATEHRQFRAYGTGHSLPNDDMTYLGTVHLNGGALVFHIYERNLVV